MNKLHKIIILIFISLIIIIGNFLLFKPTKIKPDIKTEIVLSNQEPPLIEKEIVSPIYKPLPNEKEYIYANLDKMEISIYQDGELLKTFSILSIRKIGSKFDTPTGLFEVLSKEKLHWSTIGNVWMPWSINFYGNYFIHGWPYYPDSNPVPKGYSGGCIRLSDEDAEEIYQFSKNKMMIFVE